MISGASELPSSTVKSRPLPSATCRKVVAAVVLQFGEADAADLDVHLAGFDLAQIQNVADQRQQIGSRSVNGLGELHLLGGQVLVRVLRQHARQNQQIVERRAQLVAHVGQEFALVLGSQRQLFGLLFQRLLGLLHFRFLVSTSVFCSASSWAFSCSSALVFCNWKLLALQLFGQRLALLQQLLGPHGGANRVQHDADGLRELIEKRQVNIAELAERGQLDGRLYVAFEQHRQHHDADRSRAAQAGIDPDVIARDVGDQDALLLLGALADQALADAELLGNAVAFVDRITGQQLQNGGLVRAYSAI